MSVSGPDEVWHDDPAQAEQHRTVSPARRLWRRLRGHRAALVTDAKRSAQENLRHRERAYAWLQGLRIPFLLAAGATYVWLENWWLSSLLFVISVPLPWIAVVVANGVGEPRDSRAPKVYKPAVARFEIEQRSTTALPQSPSDSRDAEIMIYDDASATATTQQARPSTPPSA